MVIRHVIEKHHEIRRKPRQLAGRNEAVYLKKAFDGRIYSDEIRMMNLTHIHIAIHAMIQLPVRAHEVDFCNRR